MEEQEEYTIAEIMEHPAAKKTLLYQGRKLGEAWRNFSLQLAYALRIDVLLRGMVRFLEWSVKELKKHDKRSF